MRALNFKVKGYTETVLSRGKVVIDNGEYIGRPGDGMFVKRGAYGGQYATADRSSITGVSAAAAHQARGG